MRRTGLWNVISMAALAVLLAGGCGAKEKAGMQETSVAETLAEAAEEETQTAEAVDEESEAETAAAETEYETAAEQPPQEGYVRSPLTNEWIPEEEAGKRPIAVMYPTDKKAQPQYGLDRVEVFYEILEEGSMSRQMGILNNWEDLERIGNIRSIRDYYVTEALEWDAIIVHFGGPAIFVKDILVREDVDNINGVSGEMGPDYGAFYRVPKGSTSEHTAYTDGSHLQKAIESAGFERMHREAYWQDKRWHFASEDMPVELSAAQNAVPAEELDMSGCYPITKSHFTYDADDGLYYRSIYGAPQKDALTGEQLAFRNILIAACDWENRLGSEYLGIRTIDSGKDAWYITGGSMIRCTWQKEGDYSPMRLYDENGEEIVLNTGKTMVCIARCGTDSFLADGQKFAF